MSWDKVKALLSENAEGLALVEELETTSKKNIDTINSLETKTTGLAEDLSKFKQGNTLVKSLLGIEQVNEETLKEALAGKGKGGDEKLLAELANFKKINESLVNDKATLSSGYEAKLQDMALTNNLRDLGIDAKASSTRAAKALLDELREDAIFEDGKIIYKKNGETMFGSDSQALTPNGRFSAMMSNPEYSGFFKPDIASGGGKSPLNGKLPDNLKDLSPTEMMKAGRKK